MWICDRFKTHQAGWKYTWTVNDAEKVKPGPVGNSIGGFKGAKTLPKPVWDDVFYDK